MLTSPSPSPLLLFSSLFYEGSGSGSGWSWAGRTTSASSVASGVSSYEGGGDLEALGGNAVATVEDLEKHAVAVAEAEAGGGGGNGSVIIRSSAGEGNVAPGLSFSSEGRNASGSTLDLWDRSRLASRATTSPSLSVSKEEAARKLHRRARATARAAWRWLETDAGEAYLDEEVARVKAAATESWRRWQRWEQRTREMLEYAAANGITVPNPSWSAEARARARGGQQAHGHRQPSPSSSSSPSYAEALPALWDASSLRARLGAGARPERVGEIRESVRDLFVANAVAEILDEATLL